MQSGLSQLPSPFWLLWRTPARPQQPTAPCHPGSAGELAVFRVPSPAVPTQTARPGVANPTKASAAIALPRFTPADHAEPGGLESFPGLAVCPGDCRRAPAKLCCPCCLDPSRTDTMAHRGIFTSHQKFHQFTNKFTNSFNNGQNTTVFFFFFFHLYFHPLIELFPAVRL